MPAFPCLLSALFDGSMRCKQQHAAVAELARMSKPVSFSAQFPLLSGSSLVLQAAAASSGQQDRSQQKEAGQSKGKEAILEVGPAAGAQCQAAGKTGAGKGLKKLSPTGQHQTQFLLCTQAFAANSLDSPLIWAPTSLHST